MKKSILIIAALLVTAISFGQNSKLRSAKSSYEDGDMQEAKEAIDAASEHDKTKDNPETWVYKALIYNQIQSTGVGDILQIEVSDEDVLDSLAKAKALDSDGKYEEQIATASQSMIDNAHRMGAIAYNEDNDYEAAIEGFERKLELIEQFTPDAPQDTISYVVIGSSYMNLQEPEKAVPYYEKAIELNYQDQGIYNGLINYYEDKDEDKFLNYLEMAKERFPEDQRYQLIEIDYYIEQGKADEKMDELKAAVEKNPDNVNLPLIISNIYEAQENYEEQVKWTEKALEIDPDNFAANLNTGAAYFNMAVKYNDEINFMSTNTTQEYKDKKALRDEYADKAKPYFDKAYEMQPENENVVQALIMYNRMYGNTERVEELLESIQ